MAEKELRPSNINIWSRLSEEAKSLCEYLGTISADRPFLETMVREDERIHDLDQALGELRQYAVLEELTMVQELEEEMERLKPKRDLLAPKARLTEEERRYLRAAGKLEAYNRNPEDFKNWQEVRLRLKRDFGQFVEDERR